jgi:hypothetical protein
VVRRLVFTSNKYLYIVSRRMNADVKGLVDVPANVICVMTATRHQTKRVLLSDRGAEETETDTDDDL